MQMQAPLPMDGSGDAGGPVIRSTARALNRPGVPANVPLHPANLQELQRRQEFTWPDTAFKEDDMTYQDNINIYDLSNTCCRQLRVFLTGSSTCRLWFVRDCAGVIAAVFTWGLVIFGELALVFGVLIHFYNPYLSAFNGLLNLLMAFLGLVAHSRCMFMDPVSISCSLSGEMVGQEEDWQHLVVDPTHCTNH